MDTRNTSNSKFIDNITAVYSDLFLKARNSQRCFRDFILIVEDMCQINAMETQNEVSILLN